MKILKLGSWTFGTLYDNLWYERNNRCTLFRHFHGADDIESRVGSKPSSWGHAISTSDTVRKFMNKDHTYCVNCKKEFPPRRILEMMVKLAGVKG